ncbi:MAG: ribose-5-phosphate isomerase [Parcubacteria group bacterium RIFCSPLOWO2_01_FULL_40_65]|nr:MAG: ribose-5-phosphate isomerase [Parcubacteria group bacterium RIFCSPHIGHO2_01_FULL_40_30]OHB19210.1 MAG: ribose-5-phosphate isomerase [Parcubacteria group bacterium RIFCSPHIGHO2_02_FULL_40_12]OHB22212.1 MAG: ribose-5-phosphate isomerase [Parcubacteria group bacterium RIFCSPLOWO2_01_FULL_40_65]OHB23287.1 MAG: ribose-5-phosphate isomerase [Parcubacteria group bacterium RIFCSPLOWO2_02_FULL_40_12]OHB24112.1 MAG: ribose-5-phosphate isomerase [Parcubacteria group bacterium RIFCSPLOWO2_12_FULL_4
MIYLATDHRGFELKEKIKQWLTEWNYEFQDMGAFEHEKDDDYPDFIHKAAEKVSVDPENSKAIILGGSGQGEAMTANKYKRVRAAVYYGGSDEVVKLSREHNNANILSLGVFFVNEEVAKAVIKIWLETPFTNEERHKRRIEKIDQI